MFDLVFYHLSDIRAMMLSMFSFLCTSLTMIRMCLQSVSLQKDQIVILFSFKANSVSIAAFELCFCSIEAAIENI